MPQGPGPDPPGTEEAHAQEPQEPQQQQQQRRQQQGPGPREEARLELVWSCPLWGVVESLAVLPGRGAGAGVQQRDALLLTFRDAKLSVVQWDPQRWVGRVVVGAWVVAGLGVGWVPRSGLAGFAEVGRQGVGGWAGWAGGGRGVGVFGVVRCCWEYPARMGSMLLPPDGCGPLLLLLLLLLRVLFTRAQITSPQSKP